MVDSRITAVNVANMQQLVKVKIFQSSNAKRMEKSLRHLLTKDAIPLMNY